MKIGLIDVDSHNFPNLALMKISAYHKSMGDNVEWWNGFLHYDKVYKSKVFDDTYTEDELTVINATEVIKGGTGYDLKSVLPFEVENQYPDYSLYPQFKEAYGYLTRGCPRNCGFCIVSKKEGKTSKKVADLKDFWHNQKTIKLLDPNLLACKDYKKLLLQLINSNAKIDFTQGLDIRRINDTNISLIQQIKIQNIHFAWDNINDENTYKKLIWFAKNTNLTHRNRTVYILTNYNSTHQQDLERINKVWELGYSPFVMIYNKPTAPKITVRLQRWANDPHIFKSKIEFSKYNRNKGDKL